MCRISGVWFVISYCMDMFFVSHIECSASLAYMTFSAVQTVLTGKFCSCICWLLCLIYVAVMCSVVFHVLHDMFIFLIFEQFCNSFYFLSCVCKCGLFFTFLVFLLIFVLLNFLFLF
jgi:hypothetical protein